MKAGFLLLDFFMFKIEDEALWLWLVRIFMVLNAKHGSNNVIHSFMRSIGVLSVYNRAGFF